MPSQTSRLRIKHVGRRRDWLMGFGIVAAFAWSVIRSGMAMLGGPEIGVEAAQVWPQRLDSGFLSFISDSPLGLITFQILDLATPQAWVLMHVVAVLLAMWVFAGWALVTSEPGTRAHSARLVLLAPIATVMLTGIGSYDPFTILAMLLVLFAILSSSRLLVALSGVVIGFQHFEQGLLGILALAAVWSALKGSLPRAVDGASPLWALVGLVAGRLFLTAIFLATDVQATGRPQWITEFFIEWSLGAITTGPLLLWSLFAGMWALILYIWIRFTQRDSRLLLLGAFAAGLIGLLLSGDRPRVFVVILAPALALLVVTYTRLAREERVVSRLIEGVVWLAPPLIFAEDIVTNVNIVDVPYTLFLFAIS